MVPVEFPPKATTHAPQKSARIVTASIGATDIDGVWSDDKLPLTIRKSPVVDKAITLKPPRPRAPHAPRAVLSIDARRSSALVHHQHARQVVRSERANLRILTS